MATSSNRDYITMKKSIKKLAASPMEFQFKFGMSIEEAATKIVFTYKHSPYSYEECTSIVLEELRKTYDN